MIDKFDQKQMKGRFMAAVMTVLFSAFLLLSVFPRFTPVLAEGNVSMTVQISPAEMKVGDTGILQITISSDTAFQGVYINVQYDSTYLNYYSSQVTGSAGSLIIKENLAQPQTFVSYDIGLEALLTGEVTVNVSGVVYADAIGTVMDSPFDAAVISISEEGILSADASLSSLSLSYGTLEPEFSPSVYQYKTTVPNEISSVTITAIPGEEHQTITIGGESTLAEGDNIRTINVIAQDGTTSMYSVTITREAAEESSEEESAEEEEESVSTPIKVDGISHYLVTLPEDAKLPEGFERTEYTYQDHEYQIGQSKNGLKLFYLVDFKGEDGDLFWYDENGKRCVPCEAVMVGQDPYLLLNADKNDPVPTNYARMAIRFGEETMQAYATNGAENNSEYIVIAVGPDGQRSYYVYDVRQKSIHPYRGNYGASAPNSRVESAPEESSVKEESKADPAPALPMDDGFEYRRGGLLDALDQALPYILLGLGLLLLIIVLVVALVIRNAKRKNTALAQEQDAFDEDIVMTPSVTVTEADEEPATTRADHWKHITQQVPLAKMTEVHTTTLAAIYEADEASVEMMTRHNPKLPEEQQMTRRVPSNAAGKSNPAEEEAYDRLSPTDFFE